jgi:murein biosynthesis integral membrane protein MurJ
MCAESLAALLAPGFSDETQRLTAQLIRVMIVGGVLLALSSLTYITLNSYRRFALPASGDLVQKVAPVLFALLLAPQLGIFSFAFGVLVGSAGRLLLHTGGLARQLRWLDRPRGDSGEDLRRLSVLIAPLVLGVAFAQLTDLADNYFSSQVGAGAVAAKTYARKIAELPILLLPYALSVVLFPFLASLANRGDWDRMHDLLARTLRSLALVFAFLTVVTVLLAEPLVTLLLERGAFNEGARALTVWPLRLYGIGLVTFAIEAILVPFYYSLQDTRTPVALGILGVIVNVALTVALIGPLGVGGVALALTLSKTLKVMTLALLLRYKHFAFELSSVLACVLIVSVAAAAAAVGVGLFILIEPFPGPSASLLEQVAYLVFASLTAAVPFLGCVLLIRSPERLLALEGGRALLQLLRGSHN